MNLKTDQQKISNLKNKKIKERGKLTMLQGQKKKPHRTNRRDNIKQFNIQVIGVPGTRRDKAEQKTY